MVGERRSVLQDAIDQDLIRSHPLYGLPARRSRPGSARRRSRAPLRCWQRRADRPRDLRQSHPTSVH
jgi:hypothetical protein